MIPRTIVLAAAIPLATACTHLSGSEPPAPPGFVFAETFGEDEQDLEDTGRNRYFVLEPGYTLRLEGQEGGQTATLVIRVLDETREIGGVRTRIVEERETRGSVLAEVSRDYFVISRKTGNVYYFGEDVDAFGSGSVADHGGSWKHRSAGARYGMMMPGSPTVGSGYYQEFAPEIAMDRARILSLDESVDTPAGRFDNCLKTEETTPLEPDAREYKYYAPGIGLVRDGSFRLVDHGKN